MKILIITLVGILSPVFLNAEDGAATPAKEHGAMTENSEMEMEAKAASKEKKKAMDKAAKKQAAQAEQAIDGPVEPKGLAEKAAKMPPGQAKQAEKKANQMQKDADKAAPQAQEKRKKWWKLW